MIKIENVHIHLGATALPVLLAGLFAPAPAAEPAAAPVPQACGKPAIGEYWEGQGGIYAGDMVGDDGTRYGLIVSTEEDVGRARWAQDGELSLSDWDGLENTKALTDCPAAKLAAGYEKDGHDDFYLPARRELSLCAGTIPSKFGTDSWYWTSTPRLSSYAWAVYFEDGLVNASYRPSEFRVRPVRRFIY